MGREPEWTAENMNRKKGDTTFKLCGWCKFAGSGPYRYGAMLSGNCELLSSYAEHREFDSTCIIKTFGKIDLRDIIESKEREIANARQSISDLKTEIAELKKLKAEAVDKPPAPIARRSDHFNIGDSVRVFYEDKWNRGTVVNGYRHHDGCVSYVLDDYPKSVEGWGCGFAVLCIMLESEYRYFLKHPLDFEQWLRNADRKYNGERLPMGKYYEALARS